MLKHAGELARELFQDTLFAPPLSRVVERRLEAVVSVRENRQAHIQELSFGARPFILCGLPIRRLPAGSRVYTRRNGKFFLEIIGHPEYGIPFGQDRLVLLWLATEAVRTRNPVVRFESASQILTDWGLTTGGEYYRRLASSFRRVFGSTIFFGTQADRGRSEVWDWSRVHFIDHVSLWFQHGYETDGRGRENLVTLSAPFWEELRDHPIPVGAAVVRALANNPGCLDLYT
jgi:Plasmid encoded RepA protein